LLYGLEWVIQVKMVIDFETGAFLTFPFLSVYEQYSWNDAAAFMAFLGQKHYVQFVSSFGTY